MGNEEMVCLKIPKSALSFAEFYAGVCREDRDALLTKVLVERLAEIRDKHITILNNGSTDIFLHITGIHPINRNNRPGV